MKCVDIILNNEMHNSKILHWTVLVLIKNKKRITWYKCPVAIIWTRLRDYFSKVFTLTAFIKQKHYCFT